jgi:hypothetical protein
MTRVVHCKKEPYDVYIGRPSVWGNPFVIGKDGTRGEVIAKYREYLLSNPDLMARVPELEGKTLGCWCSPEPCHGDVLIEVLKLYTTKRALRVALDFLSDDRNLTPQGRLERDVLLGDMEAIEKEHRAD